MTLGTLAKPSKLTLTMSVIGDASFSLYLFHSFPNRGVLQAATTLGLNPTAAPWLYLAIALILGILMSIAMFHLIEAPTTRVLRRWLKCGSERDAAVPLAVPVPAGFGDPQTLRQP